MIRIPGMPLLPGTQFRDLTRTNFAKPQNFMNHYGVGMLADRDSAPLADASGGAADTNCPPPDLPSIYPPKVGPKLPPWIAYDKQCLCFRAYFKETLQEVYHAPYTVRKVKIYYYLEDGTMQVSEPKVLNSGTPQGTVVHRQRVPKPAPCQHEFITMLDLNVNSTINIFDRIYHIYDCDLFTRHFLNRAGIPVPDPVEPPDDPLLEHRKRAGVKIVKPTSKKFELAQFLQFDRKVLKFFAYWDDRSEFGDVRNLEVKYYLADDTMDIKENYPVNSGRDGPSTFLKRSRIPRDFQGLPLPGVITRTTLLNVLEGGPKGGRYVEDALQTGKKETICYTDKDLQIGAVLNIYGRSIVLTDCDAFTREYYRKKYGIEDFTPLPHPSRCDDRSPQRKERIFPPFNGWGSYEDSEGNCMSVIPKPPQGDFKKFIKFDKFVLRFGAKMMSTIRENCERIFIVSYYLSDDTIQIYEVSIRNSGFLGGEFAKRRRIPLPGQEIFTSKRPDYYKSYHFYIGATLNLKDHIFVMVSADEYTLLFMEAHPFEYPLADVKAIMSKIREAVKLNYKEFVAKNLPNVITDTNSQKTFVHYETLKKALVDLLGDNIVDHEIITLCRYFSAEQEPSRACNRDVLKSVLQFEIRKNLWDDLGNVKEHLHHINPMNKPFVSEVKLRSTLKGCRLPFSAELVDDWFTVLHRNEEGDVEVCDFLSFIDVSCNPAPDIAPINYAFELCPKIPFLNKGRLINWSCFLQYLGLEDELAKQ